MAVQARARGASIGSRLVVPALLIGVLLAAPGALRAAPGPEEITTATLLDEMFDLAGLARLADPPFCTVQFSSYDRRSTAPDAEGWFANADGFGNEPIPGFEAVLQEAGENGIGTYLVCDVEGPGAIVRGWSAGMGGVLRVFVDGSEAPLFEGAAYDFLARRSAGLLAARGLAIECDDAFIQQDADYFPIPFAGRLRVTWEGKLAELHFYHLQVRLYAPGTRVRTFDPEADLDGNVDRIYNTVNHLAHPSSGVGGEATAATATIEPQAEWEVPDLPPGPAAIAELRVRVRAAHPDAALRGTLLRIAFDGASSPQVDAPLGDFFSIGPGIHPAESLPFTIEPDGTMICRFVMPFRQKARITLRNTTAEPFDLDAAVATAPWQWDDRSLYFRARWRVDHGMALRGPIDLPCAVVRGQGKFVGVAVQIVNPSPVPTPYGSWWGEGDEKVFVDNEARPAAFGTGSEDYFNYSWSRPDLFDHPFCGQPLNSGPGNSGYVTNTRWQILDAIPFDDFFAFYLEAWHHRPFPGLSYGRCAYLYARPGAADDHRELLAFDLIVPPIAHFRPEPILGAHGGTFMLFDSLAVTPGGSGESATGYQPEGPSTGRILRWRAEKDAVLRTSLAVPEDGDFELNLVALHLPAGGALRVVLDGEPLVVKDLGGAETGATGAESLSTKSRHVERRLNTSFERRTLAQGEHELIIECLEPGEFGFDYLWLKKQ